MSIRNKYLEILNLPSNASKEEIRKQFRKLAKVFHPDKNKSENAAEQFQRIKQAYDFLLEERQEPVSQSESTPTEELKRMERIRKAKERLRERRLAEEKKIKDSYHKLTSGLQWKIYSIISIISLCSSLLLLIEPILPKHLEKQLVTEISSPYNGFTQDEIFLIKTNQQLKIFCQYSLHQKLFYNDSIYVERSFVFHNPTTIFHRSKLEITKHKIDFSLINVYPFTSFLFLIPFWVQRKKRLTASYIFMYKFSFYVIEGLFLLFLFTQDRWFHFLTAGFL